MGDHWSVLVMMRLPLTPLQDMPHTVALHPGNGLNKGGLQTGTPPKEVTYRCLGQITEMEKTERKQRDGKEGAMAILWGTAGSLVRLVPVLRCQSSA